MELAMNGIFNVLVTYNNGKLIISETKQGIQSEVETILQNSKKLINIVHLIF